MTVGVFIRKRQTSTWLGCLPRSCSSLSSSKRGAPSTAGLGGTGRGTGPGSRTTAKRRESRPCSFFFQGGRVLYRACWSCMCVLICVCMSGEWRMCFKAVRIAWGACVEVPGRGTGRTPRIGRLRPLGEDESPPWTSSQRSPSPPRHDCGTEHTAIIETSTRKSSQFSK